MRHPLDGVKVVDLAGYIAGAYCSSILADLGARVVKVESFRGDGFRDMGGAFQGWNRGKRAVVLDLKKAEGRRVLYQMVERADVVTENYRPGVSQRLGVDYETLSRLNPRIVYCSVTGYGSTGPYAQRPAFDPLLQAQSGAMMDQGGPGNPPMFLRVAISDYTAAILAAFGIVAALLERERTGRGQHVETCLLNAAIAAQAAQFLLMRRDDSLEPAVVLPRVDHMGVSATYRNYRAKDGWLFLSCPDDRWEALCHALGIPELARRYPDAEARRRHDAEVGTALEEAFARGPVATWLDRLRAAGIPCARVGYISDMHDDPQAQALGLTTEADSPDAGPIRQMGLPLRFSATPGKVWGPAPAHGQHTDEVLAELGYTEDEVARLRRDGVIM